MLKSELSQLEKLIGEVLDNHKDTDDPGILKRLTQQVKYIQITCADLKTKWIHQLFSSAKDQVITRYVHYHQAGITQLSNQISREIPVDGPFSGVPASFQDFEQILNELEKLLQFLRHQCYSYFDPDYNITIHSCRLQCKKIDGLRREVISYASVDIDPALIAVVDASVQEILANTLQSGISYRQTEQGLNLLRMVHQLIYVNEGTTTAELHRALYRQNLNTPHFLNWYQDHIQFQLGLLPKKSEQETFINQEIKGLSSIYVDSEKALEPDLLSIDLALLPWLHEKMETGANHNIIRNQPVIPPRLPLNLSVPQFALFIRIFSKAGCFPDTNVSKITRFFTRHFSTKKQDHISSKSFSRAFYSLDQTAAAIVRDYLQKMINYLDKTYFP